MDIRRHCNTGVYQKVIPRPCAENWNLFPRRATSVLPVTILKQTWYIAWFVVLYSVMWISIGNTAAF